MDKFYLFGGCGLDGNTKNELYCLNLEDFQLVGVRAHSASTVREGHSMVAHQDKLIVFGGCVVGAPSLNEVSVFDIKLQEWSTMSMKGPQPSGRDRHIAQVVGNFMVIYGGCDLNRIYSDVLGLDLRTFEWKQLQVYGDLPGPRDSMGSVVVGNRIYVFGGNRTPPTSDSDEYSNDFIVIFIDGFTAICTRILTEGAVPPKRHSLSLSNLQNRYLVLFGGESYLKCLNDVWVFDLHDKYWREITPSNHIEGRMAHAACCFKGMLVVYGGINDTKKALHEVAVLKFAIDPERGTRKGELRTFHSVCEHCGHRNSLCEFAGKFPELSTGQVDFYFKIQIANEMLLQMVDEYKDDFLALLRVFELLGSRVAAVNMLGKVLCRGSLIVRNLPAKEELVLAQMPADENDDTLDMRRARLDQWNPVLERECLVLEIHCKDLEYSPSEVAGIAAGYSKGNLLIPLLKLSNVVVIVSRTPEYISVCLIDADGKVFFVVFDDCCAAVYPHEQVFQPNFREILARSHLLAGCVFSFKDGITVFIYPKKLIEDRGEIYYRDLPLSVVLSHISYKPSFDLEFYVNSNQIKLVHIEHIEKMTVPGVSNAQIYTTNNIEYFSLMIYYKNRLIYWEQAPPGIKKRSRNEGTTKIVKTSDSRVLSKMTGLFEWNIYSKQLFRIITISN